MVGEPCAGAAKRGETQAKATLAPRKSPAGAPTDKLAVPAVCQVPFPITQVPTMQLVIHVHDEIGLTLEYPEKHAKGYVPVPEPTPGPAFDRLTANAERLLESVALQNRLMGFLPENPAGIDITKHARNELAAAGLLGYDGGQVPGGLWGNTDVEYTGAVRFARTPTAPDPAPPVPDYPAIADREIAQRLVYETLQSDKGPRMQPLASDGHRRVSLSGMRGKFALTLDRNGNWRRAPPGTALNTWIAKHERRPDLPGHAGLEAICQRAVRLLGVPAATTRTRVFAGEPAILSERTDRVVSDDGVVRARHQEEFCQAAMIAPEHRYDVLRDEDDPVPWRTAYALLRAHAADPDRATAHLTRALAATWMVGHSDMHRRNIGFAYTSPPAPHHAAVAPLYDVANSIGTRYDTLALPISGQLQLHAIEPRHWARHANDYGLNRDVTFAILSDAVRDATDAIATAAATARSEDENLRQDDVDRRVELTLKYAETRSRVFRQQLEGYRGRRKTNPQPDVEAMAAKITAAHREQPGGGGVIHVVPNSNRLVLVYVPPENGEAVRIGTAESVRHVAAIAHAAGVTAPEDIPEYERSLERDRQRQLARAPNG